MIKAAFLFLALWGFAGAQTCGASYLLNSWFCTDYLVSVVNISVISLNTDGFARDIYEEQQQGGGLSPVCNESLAFLACSAYIFPITCDNNYRRNGLFRPCKSLCLRQANDLCVNATAALTGLCSDPQRAEQNATLPCYDFFSSVYLADDMGGGPLASGAGGGGTAGSGAAALATTGAALLALLTL